jgi:hypothetical protein
MADPESVLSEVKAVLRKAMRLRERGSVEMGQKKLNRNLLRPDGIAKGTGFLGPLPMTGDYEGHVMTELSSGSGRKGSMIDQRPYEPLHPLVTPNQDPDAIAWLLAGGKPGPEIYEKASEHAKMRKSQGKSAFLEGTVNTPTDERPPAYKRVFD